MALESGHARTGDDDTVLATIDLDDDQRARCQWLAGCVFDLFAAWTAELLDYANAVNEQAHAA